MRGTTSKMPQLIAGFRLLVFGLVHIPDFFEHFSGEFNGRQFDSVIPPSMFFQNDGCCVDWVDFISSTILQRLREGSMHYLRRVGVDPPPPLRCQCSFGRTHKA